MALIESEHSSLDGDTSKSSSHKEKDELAISRRGNCPIKKLPSHDSSSNNGDEEDIEAELDRMKREEERSWNYMDSVHSTQHRGPVFGGVYFDRNRNTASEDEETLEDSCASFASFTGGDESAADLTMTEQKAAFTNLEPEMTPRRILMDQRQPSSRLIRQPSKRLSNLQLIGEDDAL